MTAQLYFNEHKVCPETGIFSARGLDIHGLERCRRLHGLEYYACMSRDDSSMCCKCRKWVWHAKKCTWFILLELRLLRVKVKCTQELGIDV